MHQLFARDTSATFLSSAPVFQIPRTITLSAHQWHIGKFLSLTLSLSLSLSFPPTSLFVLPFVLSAILSLKGQCTFIPAHRLNILYTSVFSASPVFQFLAAPVFLSLGFLNTLLIPAVLQTPRSTNAHKQSLRLCGDKRKLFGTWEKTYVIFLCCVWGGR